MWLPPLRLSFFVAITGLSIASCGTPCKDLSSQICNCEPTELEQRACMQRVENNEQEHYVSDEQMQVCADIIASGNCTCDALYDGDLRACGLAVGD